jgi:hypothetical protein
MEFSLQSAPLRFCYHKEHGEKPSVNSGAWMITAVGDMNDFEQNVEPVGRPVISSYNQVFSPQDSLQLKSTVFGH